MAFGFLDCALLLVALLVALFIYGKWKYLHFKRKGIPYVEPPVPFLGLAFKMMIQTEHITEILEKVYDLFPNEKYFGGFEILRPLVVLKDLELIKQLCVKDFDVFNGHRTIIDPDTDPIYGNFMIILKGEKWHDMRSSLSPAFTSSKMKNMFQFVEECSQQMVNNYVQKFNAEKTDLIDIEAKEALSYFTNDVIATSIFGLKINSMENPDCEFYKMGKKTSDFGGLMLMKMFAHVLMPKLMKFLNIPLIRTDLKEYYSKLVLGTMAEREKNGIIRHDMIHLLMEAKKGALKHEASTNEVAGYATVEESNTDRKKAPRQWTDYELVSQAMIFYLAGFDTTSTMLTFLMYELARNPDIQKRMQEEIDHFKLESGDLTYNDLPKLKYLDMVVTESMRLWPSLAMTDRVATRDYTIPHPSDPNGNSYEIKANECVWVPIYNIHRDPKYFPNPLKFDPERFSDENKRSILPGSYLPFGLGPRNCIGSRFALMIVKAAVFHLVGTFDIVVTAKTQIPLKLDKKTFNMNTEKGMWVGLKMRTPQLYYFNI